MMKKIFTILAFLITTSIVAQDTFTQKHSEKLDERLSVDLPLVYPVMGAFFNGYKFNLWF